MKTLSDKIFGEERALYGSKSLIVEHCSFDGKEDGESALKESTKIKADSCFFNLRYPFWHDNKVWIKDGEMTDKCRAALWYSKNVRITGTIMHGIKAIRECKNVRLEDCGVISPEFCWRTQNVQFVNTKVNSEYFAFECKNLTADKLELDGKYSFQYLSGGKITSSVLNTKDAFWHSRNVVVRDSIINGEYLGWYSNGLTLINCKIKGTQPFCYCTNLKLVNCEMIDTDLCFEKSSAHGNITTTVKSIKNFYKGKLTVSGVDEIITTDLKAKGKIVCESK